MDKIILPSNKKFGFFFTIIFLLISIYFFLNKNNQISIYLLLLAFLIFFITLLKPDLLTPLNSLWMKLGLLLGTFISPIILGILFFFIFTPVAYLMRLFNRDELNLKITKDKSGWIKNSNEKDNDINFTLQY